MFVEDLCSIYLNYAKLNNIKSEIISHSDGHIILKLKGQDVFDYFKQESGKHVVQRVPPTETKGRRQTSVISVAVLPVFQKVKEISDNEIVVTAETGTGPGGQHRNKKRCACRAVHKKSGMSVFIDGRDFRANRREALKILKSRIMQNELQSKKDKYSNDRNRQMGGGNRGDKIRTYNFIKSRVTNHINNKKTNNIQGIIKGRLDLII